MNETDAPQHMTTLGRASYIQGYEDARNGFPRMWGMGAMYRQGYDKGLSAATAFYRGKQFDTGNTYQEENAR